MLSRVCVCAHAARLATWSIGLARVLKTGTDHEPPPPRKLQTGNAAEHDLGEVTDVERHEEFGFVRELCPVLVSLSWTTTSGGSPTDGLVAEARNKSNHWVAERYFGALPLVLAKPAGLG
jgi:hypothetical protein